MFEIKTLIEFFDDNQLNNVVASLRMKPSRIVFVGYDALMSPGKISAIEKMFAMKNMKVEIEYCEIGRYDFDDIVNKLETIISENEDCCFDLTGGKELALAAMGYIAGKHTIPMVQFNVRSGKFIRVKNSENIPEPPGATLSVKESIVLGGGAILENEPGDVTWDFNDEFIRDVNTMWEICREKCSLWNKQSNVFYSFEEWGRVTDLSVYADLNAMERRGAEIMMHRSIIEPLCDNGIIRDYSLNDGILTFRYKNRQIKRCLTKAGNILELYCFVLAREINGNEQSGFTDADIGVHIDWDGDVLSGQSVKNEVDLMLMKGFIPVFVSCKNGEVHKEALYELSAVADEFGGEYAKKVLVATYISRDSESKKHFLRRAAEMGIKVIADADTLNRREFIRELKNKTE